MKLSVNKEQNWLSFTPKSTLDFFNLGIIRGKVPSVYVVTSNTDDPKPQLKEFKISVESLVQALLKTK